MGRTTQDGERTLLGSTTATSERISGGTPGTVYYFFVFPFNATGTSNGMWDSGFVKNSPAPKTLPQKHTERVDGSISSARISGGVRQQSSGDLTDVIVAPSSVSINVEISPEESHVGQKAALIVAISAHGQLFLLDETGQLLALDESNIRGFKMIQELKASDEFELFNGVLGVLDRGDYEIFVGYLLESDSSLGKIVYSAEPIRLSVR